MVPDDLRDLKESDIESLFDSKIYERGIAYFEEGRLRRPVVYHDSVMADCQGTLPEDYHIRVEIKGGNFIASCTCPYAFGYCKHIAAVTYAWLKKPGAFKDLGQSEDMLKRLDRDSLVEIVIDMIKYDPDVVYVINLRLTPPEKLPGFVDREMKSIFSGEFVDYLNVREIVKKLDIFREFAADLLARREHQVALTVIKPVVDAIVDNYTRLDDVDGLMSDFFADAMTVYGKILKNFNLEGDRRRLLNTAMDWYLIAEWGLENVIRRFLKETTADLKENRFVLNTIDVRVSEFKKSFIYTSPKYSEEFEYIEERVSRLAALRSDIRDIKM